MSGRAVLDKLPFWLLTSEPKLLPQVSIAFALRVFATGLTLVMHLTLASLLGMQLYGEFVQVFVWSLTLSVPALLGMDNAALRFVGRYRSTNRTSLLVTFIKQCLRWVNVGGVAMGGVLVIAAFCFDSYLSPTLFSTFIVGACGLPLKNELRITESILQGLGKATLSLTSMCAVPAVTAGLVLLASLIAGEQFSPRDAMICHVLATLATLVTLKYQLRRIVRKATLHPIKKALRRAWLFESLPLMLMSTCMLVQTQGSTLLLGLFLGSEDVGEFYIVLRLATVLLFGSEAVNFIVAPKFAELYGKHDHQGLQNVATIAAVIATIFVLVGGIIMVFDGSILIRLFDDQVEDGYPALMILVAGYVISAACGSVGYLMTMTGNQRTSLRVFAWNGLAHIALCAVLIPRWGIVGAALSQAISVAAWNLSLAICLKKLIGVRSYILWPIVKKTQIAVRIEALPSVTREAA